MQRARFLVALTVGLTLSSALAGCFEPAPLESSRIAPPPPREQEQEDEPVQPTSQPPPSNSSQPPPRSASNTTPPPAAAPPPLPGAFSFPNDAQGCQETLFLAPVDLGAAQALLPANYTAGDFLQFLEALVGVQALRDAAASAGVPLPDLGLGRGAVVWTVLSCAG
ncbi:MAG TPA: hypothetical protein VGR28_04445, partial [Candidatus Thermoplasmatota archaeon]|nr:hypothetical protein [Candidatus Thermoplasmatota archaeon]